MLRSSFTNLSIKVNVLNFPTRLILSIAHFDACIFFISSVSKFRHLDSCTHFNFLLNVIYYLLETDVLMVLVIVGAIKNRFIMTNLLMRKKKVSL